MLTRPGAGPGCGWMRRINESVPSVGPRPEAAPRWWRWYWLFYGAFMAVWFLVVVPLIRHSVPPTSTMQNYQSEARIAGLPLIARGEAPRGIIAIGGRPIGVVAIGGIPVGIVAVGGVGVGVLCFGGLAVGLLALGGAAVGYYVFGGLAVGGYAYAGRGVAVGYYEASGRQKERLFG